MLFFMDGSLCGGTFTPGGDRIRLGGHPDCEVRIPPFPGHDVQPEHAEIVRSETGFLLRSLGGSDVYVNGAKIEELGLEQNDTVQLGGEGPRFRYRLAADDRAIKSFQQMIVDCSSLAAGPRRGGTRTQRMAVFARQMVKESIAHGTRRFRIFVFAMLVLLGVFSVFLIEALQGSDRAMEEARSTRARSTALEEQNRSLLREIATIRAERERLETAFREEVERSAELRTSLSSLLTRDREREASLTRVLERTEAVSTVVTAIQQFAEAAQHVYRASHRGVGFVALGISFYHPEQKEFLRERVDPATGLPVTTGFPLTLGGEGKKVIEWLSGSGFLVSGDGLLLTNRHVVDPWWEDPSFADGLLDRRFRAVREHFFVVFPGREQPIALKRLRSHPAMDAALCRLEELDPALPVLNLADAESIREGDKVVLLGYPEGLQGLVNKLSRAQTDVLRGSRGADRGTLIRTLASMGGIAPTLTQGVLSNRTEESLVYDAVTASGGSGGPLFDGRGRVIGINSAISRTFTGANFGLPIAVAKALIEDARASPEPTLDTVEISLEQAQEQSRQALADRGAPGQ